jgi:endonuclease-3 related protein
VWHWSPDYIQGPMDIVAGAILVQHTAWQNAERALEALRGARALDASAIVSMPDDDLLPLIRASGTPTVKARRLRATAATIIDAGGIGALLSQPTEALRARLLATLGIGPETADAIVLYAASRPVFLIDAYTRRLFGRLRLGPEGDGYGAWQRYFEDALGREDVALFQRYHAYIVVHGKALCHVRPRCAACPLLDLCPTGAELTGTRR